MRNIVNWNLQLFNINANYLNCYLQLFNYFNAKYFNCYLQCTVILFECNYLNCYLQLFLRSLECNMFLLGIHVMKLTHVCIVYLSLLDATVTPILSLLVGHRLWRLYGPGLLLDASLPPLPRFDSPEIVRSSCNRERNHIRYRSKNIHNRIIIKMKVYYQAFLKK